MPKIYPLAVHKEDPEWKDLHEVFPRPPFRWLAVGSSESGKTTMLLNAFGGPSPDCVNYFGKFDKVYICSPTIYLDSNYEKILLAKKNNMMHMHKFHFIDNQEDTVRLIEKLCPKTSHEEDQSDSKEKILLFIDDFAGTSLLAERSTLAERVMRIRHHGVSIIISTQALKSVATRVRTNATVVTNFSTFDKAEAKKFFEEFSGKYPYLKEFYSHATARPYGFIMMDVKRGRLYGQWEDLYVDIPKRIFNGHYIGKPDVYPSISDFHGD